MATKYQAKGAQCYRGELVRALARSGQNDLPDNVLKTLGFERIDAVPTLDDLLSLLPEMPFEDNSPDTEVTDQELIDQIETENEETDFNWSFLALNSVEVYGDLKQSPEQKINHIIGEQGLTDDDLAIDSSAETIPFQPIFNKSRQRDFIRRFLTHNLGKRLDIKRLIRQVSQCQPLYSLPYQRHQVPASRLYVLADTSNRLINYHYDMALLCQGIIKVMGAMGLEIREFKDLPGESYNLWPLGKNDHEDDSYRDSWQRLDSDAEVLILSDMGQLTDADSRTRRSWLSFLQHLNQQGIVPVALSPIPQSYQCSRIRQYVKQVIWCNRGPLVANPSLVAKDKTLSDVQRVLSALSITTHIEPELLREVIQLLDLESGIEALIANHPEIQFGYTALAIKADRKEYYQQLFAQEKHNLRNAVLNCIAKHHRNQFKGVWAEELINLDAITGLASKDWQAEIDWAKGFMQRLAHTSYSGQSSNLTSYAHRHLSRLSTSSKKENDYATVLYVAAEQERIKQGQSIPPEYNTDIIQSLTAEQSGTYHLEVWLLGSDVWLRKKDYVNEVESDLTRGVRIDEFDCYRSRLFYSDDEKRLFIEFASLADYKLPVTEGHYGLQSFLLDTGVEKRAYKPIEKPTWANQIGFLNHSLKAGLTLNGADFTMVYGGEISKVDMPLQPSKEIPSESFSTVREDEAHITHGLGVTGKVSGKLTRESFSMWRQDLVSDQLLNDTVSLNSDQYGLYADLNLFGITQRFRYIEPGTFMMGSPAEEAEREDNETQHQVTLTQGYWLADTCTTQALWQAVMGDNPSHFEGEQNPVDSVSWLNCWQFIQKVKAQYPALNISLPTEAQWEYACRAGTTTPFSFGEQIHSEQVNFDGSSPYNQGEKSQDRGKTVPVKSLPENPWGLYEMHGNLWEWCQDNGLRKYQAGSAVSDPGQQEFGWLNKDEAVWHPSRGGSWAVNGRHCRSACRFDDPADLCHGVIGFRLTLGLELPS
ncbi:formylglycine-generating enzyme family protein [Oceanospirillum beijerinckii]|uniref:formylglycine-generating enzyme family protein n=1 Tax=Oceanospirillum beijerinckii TaxID=64976 RepID=UPI000425ED9F|nr:formylglycine-generating enzyme family protein [Oceanospirillum beijerinckii]